LSAGSNSSENHYVSAFDEIEMGKVGDEVFERNGGGDDIYGLLYGWDSETTEDRGQAGSQDWQDCPKHKISRAIQYVYCSWRIGRAPSDACYAVPGTAIPCASEHACLVVLSRISQPAALVPSQVPF
jgi:hypothetical protein